MLAAAILVTGCDLHPERTVWKQETYGEAANEGFVNPWTWVGLLNKQGGFTDSKGNWHSINDPNFTMTEYAMIWYPPTKGLERVSIKEVGPRDRGGDWGGRNIGEWSKWTEENQ
jgi:hypothetical protein